MVIGVKQSFVLCMLLTLLNCNGYAQKTDGDKQGMFYNTLGMGADPWVIKDGDYYYLCQVSTVKNRSYITVSKSAKLSALGEARQVWTAPQSGWNRKLIWAPELHHIGKKWYIYYAAGISGPPYINQRSGVLESVTDDPQGEYISRGMLMTGADETNFTHAIWSIDVTVTNINNQLYAVWSGWEHNALTDKTPQHLYMAKMENPWTISSERVKISSPEQPWETGGPLNINEGPEFLKHNGNIFIIYSTRESWTTEYRLGQLKLKDSTRAPLDASNWIKTGPVFQGTPNVFGTGHASFTTSPDGREWWIIYHTKKTNDGSWQREIRLQPFTWKTIGDPDFGIPISPNQLIKKPSGE
jgi:GH43 family beta-xylosidase